LELPEETADPTSRNPERNLLEDEVLRHHLLEGVALWHHRLEGVELQRQLLEDAVQALEPLMLVVVGRVVGESPPRCSRDEADERDVGVEMPVDESSFVRERMCHTLLLRRLAKQKAFANLLSYA
jgi:hypothetical protein